MGLEGVMILNIQYGEKLTRNVWPRTGISGDMFRKL